MNSPRLSAMNFIRTFLLAAALTLLATAPPAWAQMAGTLDANFNPDVNGYVYASAVQPDGKVIIGGQFTSVGGAAHANVARLNADGSADASFTTNTDDWVFSVAVQPNGNILLGGAFSKVSGESLKYLARLKPDGSVDPSFKAEYCPNGIVNKMAVQADGKIVLAGSFSAPRNTIARLNADASLDAGFNPGTGANDNVLSVAVQTDGKIVLGGQFTAVNGKSRNRIARLMPEGGVDDSFNPGSGADKSVFSVAVQADEKIVLGGEFTKVNGAPRQYIARLDSEGKLEDTATFNPGSGVARWVLDVAMQTDGKILVGGYIPLRLNADGSVDTTFNPASLGNPSDSKAAYVAVQADGKIVLSGSFAVVNGTPRNRLAQLFNDAATHTLSVPDSTQVRWDRGGAGPEVSQVIFEQSTDGGGTWKLLGSGKRIGTTSSWQLTGLSLPASGLVRAYGPTASGFGSGSSGLVQQVASMAPLERLQDGNRRYADGNLAHPDQTVQRRKEVAKGQHPFAVIVGCADSRVSPEIVFDQGLGDLFVIRIAGEVVDNSALGSIEYAVEHLHVGMIVVLGHEKCGAVDAAVDAVMNGTVYEEHVKTLVDAIEPAVKHVKDMEGDILENSVKENARELTAKLKDAEPVLKEAVEHGTVSIVAGYYDLDTGKVIFYK